MRYGTLAGTQASDQFTDAPDEVTIHLDGNFGGGTVICQFWGQDNQWHSYVDDNGNHIWNAPATRVLANKRNRTIRLSANGVGSVYFELT